MKKMFLVFAFLLLSANSIIADEKDTDPNQFFYAGNSLYEKREYDKAIEEYSKILVMNLRSPNLYYNIGNAYFKEGKIGYAILFYERAMRLLGHDADVESNLAYAKSLVGNPSFQMPIGNSAVALIKKPFEDFNIKAVALTTLCLYFAIVILLAVFIANPVLGKKIRASIVLILLLFISSVTALSLRYYDTRILKTGVVIQKIADCKYEPIDKSTTYYKLQEGDEVLILKTRNGWHQIKRQDGKIGWVDKTSVESI